MADGGTARVENGKLVGDLWENPMGTDGFEFVEYTAPDVAALGALFTTMGFTKVATHRSKKVDLYRQGDINFIVNGEADSLAQQFARDHGPSACAMAFRVKDAAFAHKRAIDLGAKEVKGAIGPMELNIPAIEGIGGSLIYLVDRYKSPASIYDIDFVPVEGADQNPVGCGLVEVDHLTHNVHRGRMDYFYDFYSKLFNFRQIRYFDIEGKLTGLKSRALTAPCGKIRIPINESAGAEGRVDQIEEYLREYKGEGIQHIALSTNDIIKTYDALKANGITFMTPPPATYYDMLEERLPGHGQPTEELRQRGILLDGAPGGGLLLQIFTATVIGPIFFEIIQRKGDDGFGEGNFRALFESIERDQVERGVLKGD
ncbi:4-hydroxyphenylpyruvate dioxygenase [Niveispirillum irakense]|uniref:4-hydroxyphenylpyruvate dioxygenase n=1 Tax=Niveispirillum irakense TaxID=34011 RepID=UPI00040423AC|nr:4-hydroxyphenylpyruvate dioxygenase [Niveispirillum irakense]